MPVSLLSDERIATLDDPRTLGSALNGTLPRLVYAIGMKAADRRRAMDVVLERQAEFMAHWRAIYGDEG